MNDEVRCKTCGKGYPAIFKESDQGSGCASDVHGDLVKGNYGSAVIDMECWEFAYGRPQEVEEGVICDGCIEGYQKDGRLTFKEPTAW